MRLNLAGLLGAAVVTGCSDSDHGYIPSAGLSGGLAAGAKVAGTDERGSKPTDRDRAGADEEKPFALKLADGTAPRDKGAVEVVVRSESARPGEAFTIRLVALVPGGGGKVDRELSLGTRDVYKPLDKGEAATVYLDEVAREAWSKRGDHYELRLVARAEPGRPGRPRPDVKLAIVDANAAE